MIESFKKLARYGFVRETRGSIAIIYAMVLLVLAITAGGAIDYSVAILVRAELSSAADAAALAAAKRGAQELAAGSSNWQTLASDEGTAYFASQSDRIQNASIPTPVITVNTVGAKVTATVTYSADVPTTFLAVAQIPSFPITGKVEAAVTVLPSTDINIVIDVSTSMGIGATAHDQQTLYTALSAAPTSQPCALACHMADTWDKDTLPAARASGAVLRIDVAKSAIKNALTTIKGLSVNSGQLRIAVYTLTNSLANVFPLSSDINGAIAAINAIDLTNANNTGGTNTTYSLAALQSLLPVPGSGAPSAAPRGFVVLMTDGVQNSVEETAYNPVTHRYALAIDPNYTTTSPNYSSTPNEILEAFDPAACTPIKTKGYKLLTMNVEYLIPSAALGGAEPRYDFIKNTLLPNIATNMQACASSPDLALLASSPADIDKAVSTLFQKTLVDVPHLTQ